MTVPAQGVGHLAAPDVGDGSAGSFVGGQVYFPGGLSLFSGNGAPGPNVNGQDTPLVGDLYLRLDGGALTTIYRCTAVGPVAWTGIL